MKKMFYIMGKSSGGKDTFYKVLLEEFGFAPVVLYTTRPMRENEQEGREYRFVDNVRFEKMVKEGTVIEKRVYHTAHGDWAYFTAEDCIPEGDCCCLGIGTLESYVQLKSHFGDRLIPIYIEVDDGIRLTRALEREKSQSEPKYKEMCRRFIADCEDFSEEKIAAAGIVRRFRNDGAPEECLDEIREYIKEEIM